MTDVYPHPSSPAASATGRGNRRRDTSPERQLGSALHAKGLRYRRDAPIRTQDILVRPDFVFTRMHVAVFIDGCFWHCCPQHGQTPRANPHYWPAKLAANKRRDHSVTSALESEGWRVVRIWEHVPLTDAVAMVTAAVAGQAPPR